MTSTKTVAIEIYSNTGYVGSVFIPASEWPSINFVDFIEFDRNTGDIRTEFYRDHGATTCAAMLEVVKRMEFITALEKRRMSTWTKEEMDRHAILTGQSE